MKLLKGVVSFLSIFLVISLIAPFNIYAAVESTIVPTYSNSSTQSTWQSHIHVTNFCDGTNNQAACKLTFHVDDNYYGMIYFDGKGPANQIIADYAVVYIAAGVGEYNYSYYQNALINITQVNINIVNLVLPDSSVDLTTITNLLTDIANDTSTIDSNTLIIKNQVISVLNELLTVNGYLDVIQNAPYANFPVESLPAVMRYLNEFQIAQGVYELIDYQVIDRYQYPMFRVANDSQNFEVMSGLCYAGQKMYFVFITQLNANTTNFLNYFSVNSGFQIDQVDRFYTYAYQNPDNSSSLQIVTYSCYKVTCSYTGTGAGGTCRLTTNLAPFFIIPIYNGNSDSGRSLEFSLRWKLPNDLLENIETIANGTAASNDTSDDLNSGTTSMQTQMNNLIDQEDSYNQQMNNSINQIDFTNPVNQNADMLSSANFVISIFNALISNNPFSILIIIVCILLIGKKVIGK